MSCASGIYQSWGQTPTCSNSSSGVDQGGTVSAWKNTGSGTGFEFNEILSASDSAFSGGNAGLQAAGGGTRLTNFKAGALTP